MVGMNFDQFIERAAALNVIADRMPQGMATVGVGRPDRNITLDLIAVPAN